MNNITKQLLATTVISTALIANADAASRLSKLEKRISELESKVETNKAFNLLNQFY